MDRRWGRLTVSGAVLPVLTAFTIYFAINLYLWSLRQPQAALFFEAAPLGVAFCVGFFWYLMRRSE
jgi:hypothetical protein